MQQNLSFITKSNPINVLPPSTSTTGSSSASSVASDSSKLTTDLNNYLFSQLFTNGFPDFWNAWMNGKSAENTSKCSFFAYFLFLAFPVQNSPLFNNNMNSFLNMNNNSNTNLGIFPNPLINNNNNFLANLTQDIQSNDLTNRKRIRPPSDVSTASSRSLRTPNTATMEYALKEQIPYLHPLLQPLPFPNFFMEENFLPSPSVETTINSSEQSSPNIVTAPPKVSMPKKRKINKEKNLKQNVQSVHPQQATINITSGTLSNQSSIGYLDSPCCSSSISSTTTTLNNDEDYGREEENEIISCKWDNCREEFSCLEMLVKHVTDLHVDKLNPRCHWAGCEREKLFSAQYMLLLHIRKHTGEKPFKCDYPECTKRYSRLENLKTHIRRHKNERPYACTYVNPKTQEQCPKAFNNASDKAKHMNRVHSSEKSYLCPVITCSKTYTDPSSLRKHIKLKYGEAVYHIATANKKQNGPKGGYGEICLDELRRNGVTVKEQKIRNNFEQDSERMKTSPSSTVSPQSFSNFCTAANSPSTLIPLQQIKVESCQKSPNQQTSPSTTQKKLKNKSENMKFTAPTDYTEALYSSLINQANFNNQQNIAPKKSPDGISKTDVEAINLVTLDISDG